MCKVQMWNLSCHGVNPTHECKTIMAVIDKKECRYPLRHIRLVGIQWGPEGAEPVLALHGWLDNAASFERLAPVLKSKQLICPDFAGHGLSAHRAGIAPYAIWDNVQDMLALLDYLNIQRCHIVGHSMGGAVAVLMASCLVDRVKSLVLLDGFVPLITHPSKAPEQMSLALRQSKRVDRYAATTYATFDEAVKARMAGKHPVTWEAAEALVKRALSQSSQGFRWHTDPCLLLPSMLRLSQDHVIACLQSIECPVLLCRAQKGILTDDMLELTHYLKDITIHHLPGGHHLHLEEQVIEVLGELLENFWVQNQYR